MEAHTAFQNGNRTRDIVMHLLKNNDRVSKQTVRPILQWVCFLLTAIYFCQNPEVALAQRTGGGAAVNLLRPEFYAARDYYDDGQLLQSFQGFESAFEFSRQVNGQRGIDSIPPAVMMGECLYEQCDIGRALEQYDTALAIALQTTGWLKLLQNPPNPIPRVDSKLRDIQWGNGLRNTTLDSFGEAWPIALGANNLLLETSSGQGVAGKMVPIDAVEILRCQAVGLRRRFLLLGPLAPHSPLTDPLVTLYRSVPEKTHDMMVRGSAICYALALLGKRDLATAANILTDNLTLANGHDHPLTAVALLALADIAIEKDDIATAHSRAIEASLVAARADQMDHLAEAEEYLGKTAFAIKQEAATQKMLQLIAAHSAKRSRFAHIRSQAEMIRGTALAGDAEATKKLLGPTTAMLLPKQVTMPRADSVVQFGQSRVHFLEGNIAKGIQSLEESLIYLRGSGVLSHGAARLFQIQLATKLVQEGAIEQRLGKPLLAELLAEAKAGQWLTHPLEQLVTITSDSSEAKNLAMRLAAQSDDITEHLVAADSQLRHRFRQSTSLHGRLLELRMVTHSNGNFADPKLYPDVRIIRDSQPALMQNAASLNQLLTPLRAAPKLDIRKWHEDDTRRWEATQRAALASEAMLWLSATNPVPTPDLFPPRYSPESFTVAPNDAIVQFALLDEILYGFMFTNGKWEQWKIEDSKTVFRHVQELVTQLIKLKSKDFTRAAPNTTWTGKESQQLRKELFPDRIWKTLLTKERWIVIPDQNLWYVPWDMLPIQARGDSLPAVAEHRICLVPTLGLVPHMVDTDRVQGKTIQVQVTGFLTSDAARYKTLTEELAQPANRNEVIDLSARQAQWVASQYVKLAADRLACFDRIELRDPYTTTLVRTDREAARSQIATWNQLPWGAPREIWLPGLDATGAIANSNGDEWLKLTLSLVAQGTRSFVVSRWPVGGESTASLFRSFQDNRVDDSTSVAWQRSILELWAERFERRTEPILEKAPAEISDDALTGEHAIFWTGYFLIGDMK